MCQKKTFYVDVSAFLPQNFRILKADISKTSTGRYLFLFIFMCGNSKCTRIQKIKNFSGKVNWVHQALNSNEFAAQNYAICLALATCILAKECYSDRSNTQRPKKIKQHFLN